VCVADGFWWLGDVSVLRWSKQPNVLYVLLQWWPALWRQFTYTLLL